ncbi:MAG: hypothetical protein Q7R54_00090 [bacterium]|nr:hypothetical protein [bacterium]
MASSSIKWTALDRIAQSHGPDWYWAVGIIALSITVAAIFLNNMLFAVLVVISTIVLFLRTLQKPQRVNYELTSRGLWINKDFHAFTEFDSFWVTEDETQPKLILKSKSMVTPLMILPLTGVDSEAVRGALQDSVMETEHHEPLSKRIMEYLGF